MRSSSLAGRFATRMALLLVVLVIAVAGIVYYLVQRDLKRELDLSLTQEVTRVKLELKAGQGVQSGSCQFLAAPDCVQLLSPAGTAAETQLPITAADRLVAAGRSGAITRSARLNGAPVRILTAPLDSGAVQVAVRTDLLAESLRRLRVVVALAGGLAAVAAGTVAYGTARRGLRPVQHLTETAERITATGDRRARIDLRLAPHNDELTRLTRSFNAMLDRLDESIDRQQRLVADASHELRTPLTSLRTNVELLRRSDLSADQRDRTSVALSRQLSEMTDLVSDLVELARGEEPPADVEDVRLDEIVTHCLGSAQRNWPRITFDADIAPMLVNGVASRLTRLVANLLDNAAKYSPDHAHVDVVCRPDTGLLVRDRGVGIAAGDQPHVFDRFYRSDDARGRPGSGLGLAIVAQVVASHDARIQLESPPDGGTTVTVTFPGYESGRVAP